MYNEDDLIPISGLQHILFCPRQYALIHLEQLWQENRFTAEGQALHERVDEVHHESRKTFRQEYGLAMRSLRYGLIGKGDLVELYLNSEGNVVKAIPVEFKRGTDKETDCDRVQLCAQALCLEDMFSISIPVGQFYYLKNHRRMSVELDYSLRETTNQAIDKIRHILNFGKTPPAEYVPKKCNNCSLLDLCMPKSAGHGSKKVDHYIQKQIKATRAECLL